MKITVKDPPCVGKIVLGSFFLLHRTVANPSARSAFAAKMVDIFRASVGIHFHPHMVCIGT